MKNTVDNTQNNRSAIDESSLNKRRKSSVIISVIAVVFIAVNVLLTLITENHNNTHTMIGSNYYGTNERTYIFSSSDISSISGMDRFINPEIIDLRGSSISCDDSIRLAEMYPDCKIRWYVPLTSPTDSFSSDLKLHITDSENIDLLPYFPYLTRIDAYSLDFDVVEKIINQRPDCSINWDMKVGTNRYSSDAEVISFTDASAEEILNLTYFDNLKQVNAAGCTEYDALLDVSEKMPDCEFIWSAKFCGIEVFNTDTEINFKRKKVADINSLNNEFELLKYFPNIKTIDMCGCGVASEQMAKWRDRYTDIKFIWEVTFGTKSKNWTVRTDIKVFSTLLGSGSSFGSQEMYKELLLYCTDLVALDLGHNQITDLSLFTNLKNLQGLILTDNPISDVSPLAELPNIQFLELNMSKISDLTPFKKCSKLVHLDVHYARVRDISPLYECDNLEVVILASNNIPSEQKKEIKKQLPNCKVTFTVANDDYYTRNSPIRSSFRLAFKNYTQVEDFIDWQHVTYKDGAELTYPRGYIDYSSKNQ